jgi:predicted Zn-dependent protease
MVMRKKSPFFIFGWLLVLLSVSCAVNPVTGNREFMLISESAEISLGQETDQQIRSQYGVYDDPALTEYVSGIGATMVDHTHRPNLTYHFAVLDTPVVNAFAVPGGYIYVTRGILAMMNSEAELAVVLGHELGHVNARHSVRSMSKMILVQVGLAVGSALNETFAEITGVAGIGIQLLFLKFSRDDEHQADQLGVQYSRSGNYNPEKMVDFFSSLQKLGDLSGGHSLPGFLSTHPLTKDRIENTKNMVLASDAKLQVRQNNYFNRIDNMVYGSDPQQGFVEGNAFYHPAMRFAFSFPPDWKIQNSPSQVVLAPENGNGAVILQVEKSSENLKTYADKKASSLEGRQILHEQDLNINGMTSYQQLYNIPQTEADSLKARLSFIQYDDHIYSFTALSTENDFNKYDFQFGTIVGSFNRLTDRSYLSRRPKRLQLIKADGRSSLKSIFQQAGMEEDLWSKFAIMNSMEIDQKPARGRLVKIIK